MLKVIGAGFGRTGTHSLAQALTILGFGPCYTIQDISRNPTHHDLWFQPMNGQPINWDILFNGYNSAVEWPTIAFLPQLLKQYPQSKFILTLRDPESWFESANQTIFDGLELSAHNPDPVKRERGQLVRRLILEETFHGRYRDKDYAINIYNQHNQQVVELIPPNQLLQYQITEGWPPLCHFLNQPIPTDPFPRLNKKTEFINSAPDWARKIKPPS
jgi:hypothetical protein